MDNMKKFLTLLIVLSLSSCDSESNNENRTLVFINDGSIQCESEGLSEVETARQLKDYGVDVFQSSCGYVSNIAIAAQCGLGTNNINIHLIAENNVIDAENIGFKRISNLETNENKGYEQVDCK